MRYLLTSTALVLGLAGLGAMAADPANDSGAALQSVTSAPAPDGRDKGIGGHCRRGGAAIVSGSPVSLQRLIGSRVTNPINEDIGYVDDLMIDQCGRIKSMIVRVGGFFGIGGRFVRIPLEKFRIRSREDSPGMVMMVRETREHILNNRTAAGSR